MVFKRRRVMKVNRQTKLRAALAIGFTLLISIASTRLRADSGTCGGTTIVLPFTDVAGNPFFCEIAEAFFAGLTNGTTPTTYSPRQNVSREQMAAFITRTMDQTLKRGSRRAALKQFWSPTSSDGFGFTTVGGTPVQVECDGADLWVTDFSGGTVSRVRASDGKLLETWTGATNAGGVVVATGKVFVAGYTNPGKLYQIDPTQPAGMVTTLTSSLGDSPRGISFDGSRIWTANRGGSVSIVSLGTLTVNTVPLFIFPTGLVFDGANMWVTDQVSEGKLFKLDSNGVPIQTVDTGAFPTFPVFDGTNIWVPNSGSITVVRASTGTVIATLDYFFIESPIAGAFDGERILFTDGGKGGGGYISVWKAADLTPINALSPGEKTSPDGVCSDGLNFWISLSGTGQLARY
jgi:S-layer family protein